MHSELGVLKINKPSGVPVTDLLLKLSNKDLKLTL